MLTRNTRQRQLILDLMEGNHSHPTADEVYEHARAIDPHISRGTVYRNLNVLAQAGQLTRVTLPGSPDRYDCRVDHHYHFVCRKCGKTVDLPLEYREELNASSGLPGYEVESHRLMLVGLCPDCRKKE